MKRKLSYFFKSSKNRLLQVQDHGHLHSIIENRSRFAFCSKSARLKKSWPLLATFMKNAICISMKHAGSDAYFTQIIYPHYLPLISIRFESSSSTRRFTMDPKLFLHSHPGRWFQNRAGSNQHVQFKFFTHDFHLQRR